jgi:hypothetical protein
MSASDLPPVSPLHRLQMTARRIRYPGSPDQHLGLLRLAELTPPEASADTYISGASRRAPADSLIKQEEQ